MSARAISVAERPTGNYSMVLGRRRAHGTEDLHLVSYTNRRSQKVRRLT
jgi:hypothetical protein